VRGDDAPPRPSGRVPYGSAPHARGRHEEPVYASIGEWISPACAGTTMALRPTRHAGRDQPRVRGDDRHAVPRRKPTPRSAPRARGRLAINIQGEYPFRISPACAGTTMALRPTRHAGRDQPRVRGDDRHAVPRRKPTPRSAPRARGRLAVNLQSEHPLRISPACAGTTASALSSRPAGRDQPRVRGDDYRFDGIGGKYDGSAPRARGRHFLSCDDTRRNPSFSHT